ncbi:hypothetical protein GGE12_000715 [Rhizobium mongolense]|uniref:Uncharacterized protein n=1 Tax=Rhizobium mongolense TaxID=57676 RepID=A0A7W6RJA7_9HYPH|nr:hypothetical protein [Rhizobium mongolense]
MMLTFGCTFLLVARFGSREAHHGIGRKSGHCLLLQAGMPIHISR